MKKIKLLLLALIAFSCVKGQYINRDGYSTWTGRMGVGIPSSITPNSDSHLQLGDSATTKALWLPRFQTTAAISIPRQGMFGYSIGDSSLKYRTLNGWRTVVTNTSLSTSAWMLGGNDLSTVDGRIGSTSNHSYDFIANGITQITMPAYGMVRNDTGSNVKMFVWDSVTKKPGFKTLPNLTSYATGLQSAIILNATLSQNNTIAGGGFNWTHDNVGTYIIKRSSIDRFKINSGLTALYSPDGNQVFEVNNTGSQISAGDFYFGTATNLSTQDRLIGQRSATGQLGYLTAGSGVSILSGVISATGSGGTLTNLTATNNYAQTWTITNPTTTPNLSLVLDTTLFSTRLWRQKGIDSVVTLLAGKVNISDTSGMLSNYLRTAGDLSPLFITSEGSHNISFTQSNAAATSIFGNFTSGSTTPSFNAASADGQFLVRRSGALTFGGIVTGDLPSLNTLAWRLTGNSGTTAGTNFLGTTDEIGLMIKLNSVQAGLIELSNGIGVSLGNTSIGYGSMLLNSSGSNNTAFGVNTLPANTSGQRNVAMGVSSLSANTTGYDNTAVGMPALAGTTVGYGNSAFGRFALDRTSTGYINVAVGYNAGDDNTTGHNNIFIGAQSQAANTTGTGSYNIVLGDSSFLASGTADYQLVIGNIIYGTLINGRGTGISTGSIGIGVKSPSAQLHLLKTTEQFRVGYDVSNYYSTTVGSTGGVTFNAVGSGSAFTFSDVVNAGSFVGALTGNATTATALATGRTISVTGDVAYTSGSFDGTGNVTGTGTLASIISASSCTYCALTYDAKGRITIAASGSTSGFATVALDNLSGVAINAALVLGTSDAFALGSTTKQWSDLFLAEGGVINFDNGDATITQVGDVVTVAGADLKVTTPGNVSTSVATIDGAQSLTNKTYNGNTLTAGSSTYTGTAAATYTFPGASKTIAANDGSNWTISGQAIGDIPVASSTTAYGKLADAATGNALISGGAGVAPSYGKIGLTTHVSGTLAYGNGGTGATSFTNHGVVVAGASALSTVAPGSSGNVLTSNGTDWISSAPSGGGLTIGDHVSSGLPNAILYENGGEDLAVSANFTYDPSAGFNVQFSGTERAVQLFSRDDPTTSSLILNSGGVFQLGGTDYPHIVSDGTSLWLRNSTNNANIGINTATPSVALDVVGEFKVTGNANATSIFLDDANQYLIASSNCGIQFSKFGAGAATFDAFGRISSVSDARLKFIQGDYKVGLKEVMNIKPILYKWRAESGMETKSVYPGFTAQNIESSLGSLAIGINAEGYKSIQDRAIMAALVNSVQTLQAEIIELRKQIKHQK